MNPFVVGLLWGLGVGLVLVPMGFWLLNRVKRTNERRDIKRKLMRNEFLIPIDRKDYDVKMWEDKIDNNKEQKEVQNLNKIFIKKEETEQDETVTA